MKSHFFDQAATPFRVLFFCFVILSLAACGGGGSNNDNESSSRSVSGSGVKGPLANAVVSVYAFDGSVPDLRGELVNSASTNSKAEITGMALPFPLNPPYIMEFTVNELPVGAGGTVDISTNLAPVISSLTTVITSEMLTSGLPLYATPLTTIAVQIAATSVDGTTSITGFEDKLAAAAGDVVNTLGFGMSDEIDIFTAPPLVTDATDSAEEQAEVIAYRRAVEAVSAIVFAMDEQSSGDIGMVISELSKDLADGEIDGMVAGASSAIFSDTALSILQQEPSSLVIPNTNMTIADIKSVLASEALTTETVTPVGSLESIDAGEIKPVETNPDIDGDLVLNSNDAFPRDATESVDSDGDGIGDVADTDDNNNGILDEDEEAEGVIAGGELDGDSDGVLDATDNCPTNYNPSQTNTNEGENDIGDACDPDDDGDGTPDVQDRFPLDSSENRDADNDGVGDVADPDDDNDGLSDDTENAAVNEDIDEDGIPNREDRDSDADGVFDQVDAAPYDASIKLNLAPVTSNSTATTNEDASLQITLTATDDLEGVLTFSAVEGPANGALTGTAPDLTYTPTADFSGSDSFTFTATDSNQAKSSAATVTVTVTAVDDAPTITGQAPTSAAEGAAYLFQPVAADVEGDALSFSIGGKPAWASFDVANGELSGTPSEADGGITFGDIIISVTANELTASLAAFSIAVAEVSSTPVATDASVGTNEDISLNITLQAVDGDGDTLTYTIVSGPTKGTLTGGTDSNRVYTSAPNLNGGDSFTFMVTDSNQNLSNVATISINIVAVDDAPIITGQASMSAAEGVAYLFQPVAADVEGDALSFSIGGKPAWASFDVANGELSGTPGESDGGTTSSNIVISVTANEVTVSLPAFSITVAEDNTAPVAEDFNASTDLGLEVSITLQASDADGDDLVYAIDDPTNGTLAGVAPNLTYTPNSGFEGVETIAFSVTDVNNASDSAAIQITVGSVEMSMSVADLLDDSANAGGIGSIEGYDNGEQPEFEYWADYYSADTEELIFEDLVYSYESSTFEPESDLDDVEYKLTSFGTWEPLSNVIVLIPENEDGSMDVGVRVDGNLENVSELRISATAKDIEGDSMADHLENIFWVDYLKNPNAVFTEGALLVTSYEFKYLTSGYTLEKEDWCDGNGTDRWLALNESCNGVYIESTEVYATSLSEVTPLTAWVDNDTRDRSGLVAVSVVSYNDTELLAELVVGVGEADGIANYYILDHGATNDADYIRKLDQSTSTWTQEIVKSANLILFTLPQSLEDDFPLEFEQPSDFDWFLAVFDVFVRIGDVDSIGKTQSDVVEGEPPVFNGAALNQILSNFSPDGSNQSLDTELLGTWVNTSTDNDLLVLVFMDDGTYLHFEVDEVAPFDEGFAESGMEWGAYRRNPDTGDLIFELIFDNNGGTGFTDFANGVARARGFVSGDNLTFSSEEGHAEGSPFMEDFSLDFQRADSNGHAGTWTFDDVIEDDLLALIFFEDLTYILAQVSDGDDADEKGMEWGTYSRASDTGELTIESLIFDNNRGVGLSENTEGLVRFQTQVSDDKLTLSVDESVVGEFVADDNLDFTRRGLLSIDMTEKVAFSATTYSGCPGVPGGWTYTFTEFEMTLSGSDSWDFCVLQAAEDLNLTVADFDPEFDIPFNCVDYPVCRLADLNKIITGVDEGNRPFTSTYSFNRNDMTMTYIKEVTNFGVLETYTEVTEISDRFAPPITFADPAGTSVYGVYIDNSDNSSELYQLHFNVDGLNVTSDDGQTGTYILLADGIIRLNMAGEEKNFHIAKMLVDSEVGADKICWADSYKALFDCESLNYDDYWFDNAADAQNYYDDALVP